MELGSPEHKQLLLNSIRKTALKTLFMGGFVSLLLMTPSLIYSNTFSNGLALAGLVLLLFTLGYSGYTAWRKYQKLIKPFEQTFAKKTD